MDKWKAIRRVKFAGKWVEIWFEGEERSECCKNYMLWELVSSALEEEINNHGWRGVRVRWGRTYPDKPDKVFGDRPGALASRFMFPDDAVADEVMAYERRDEGQSFEPVRRC